MATQKNKKSILFLCTGNSCRSQIAEGFGYKYLSNYNISSAGTEAHGINLNAIKTMDKIGIDISSQVSKKINLNNLNNYDLIITLCGDAKDKCPVVDINKIHIHWGLEDPAKYKGNDKIDFFRKVRDQIREHINNLRDQIEK